MFIAVIQENFDVSEDEKRLQQVKAFLQNKEQGFNSSDGYVTYRSAVFRLNLSGICHSPPSSSWARLAGKTLWTTVLLPQRCFLKMP